jgi:hypothetical protein
MITLAMLHATADPPVSCRYPKARYVGLLT